ncbi:MAG TPA: hypothetical protein VMZ53_25125 [Kofleriaceae bacterium]|nr:hypothetical protein [Kofleriaceae bacterium]
MSGVRFDDLFAAFVRIPGAVGRYFADRKHRKWMRKAPTFRVRDMPENMFAKIVGHVRPFRDRAIEAPLSKRLCVYYDVSIDAMVGNSMLRTLATVQDGIPFVLRDDSGAAVIDPAHAFVSSGIDAMSESRPLEADAAQRELLVRTGLAGRTPAMLDSLRFREAVLELDEMVAVFGGGIREPDPEGVATMTYRDGAPTRLHLTGTAKFPLFISDDPRSF